MEVEQVQLNNNNPMINLYTTEEDTLLKELKEVQKLDWNEVWTAFNERFPHKTRSRGSLQVRYSRSLRPGKKSRPRSNTTTGSTADQSGVENKDSTKAATAHPEFQENIIAASDQTTGVRTRAGRLVKASSKALAPEAISKRAKPTNVPTQQVAITAKKNPKPNNMLQLDNIDRTLLAEAMADSNKNPNWDCTKQGQPPLPYAKPRLSARRSRPRNTHNRQIPVGEGTKVRQSARFRRSRIRQEHVSQRDFSKEIFDEQPPRVQSQPVVYMRARASNSWEAIHPVVLANSSHIFPQVPWAYKFPGPNRILERRIADKSQMRLRARRPGELQPDLPEYGPKVWEFVGADSQEVNVHIFENFQYGSNWVMKGDFEGQEL